MQFPVLRAVALCFATLLLVGCHGRCPAAPSTQPIAPTTSIVISATIDGSDDLRLTPTGLTWRHKTWDPPSNVTVNGHPWDIQSTPTLSWSTLDLHPSLADFRHYHTSEREGRDTIITEPDDHGLLIHFTDEFGGADTYRLRIDLGIP